MIAGLSLLSWGMALYLPFFVIVQRSSLFFALL